MKTFRTLAFLLAAAVPGVAASLTFQQAVELAAQHSAGVTIAAEDQTKSWAAYVEARSQYLPQVMLGSGLGYSNGFPLSLEGSAPSIFNVNSQQFLFNPAQQAFIRAARAQWHATAANHLNGKNRAIFFIFYPQRRLGFSHCCLASLIAAPRLS